MMMMMMMINSQSNELKITNSFNRQSEYLFDMETIKTKALLPSHSLHDIPQPSHKGAVLLYEEEEKEEAGFALHVDSADPRFPSRTTRHGCRQTWLFMLHARG